jgi:hypothetical protein
MASPEDQFHGEEGEEELPTLRVRASVNPDIKQQRMRLMARNPSDVAALAHNRRASLPARARVWTPNDDYKINSNHSPSSSPGNSSSARHRANSVGADKTSFESRRKKPARRSSLPPGLDPGIKPMDPGHSSASTYPKTESNGLFQATSLYHHPQSMDRVEDKSFETMRRGFVERWRQQPWRPRVVQVMDDMRSQCILFVALLIALYAADIAGIVSVSDDMMPMVRPCLHLLNHPNVIHKGCHKGRAHTQTNRPNGDRAHSMTVLLRTAATCTRHTHSPPKYPLD